MDGAFEKMNLKEIKYDNLNFTSYFLPAEKVETALQNGAAPEITLEEKRDGQPAVAVLLARWKHPEREEKDYFITRWFVDIARKHDFYPVFISHDKVKEQLDHCNPAAVLLPGGDFAFPKDWYVNDPPEDNDLKRFDAYIQMIGYARERRLPLFGVCAGEQALGGFLGGKIVRGLNDDPDRTVTHRGSGAEHEISIAHDSLLHDIIGKDSIRVSSSHHEAVSREHEGDFNVTAISMPDGIAEAIEPKNPWNRFVLTTQWHAEAEAALNDNSNDAKIFRAFANSIQR
jgi:gamma-glutamyl-gamma-aminobutyrate hydrolase PuuD